MPPAAPAAVVHRLRFAEALLMFTRGLLGDQFGGVRDLVSAGPGPLLSRVHRWRAVSDLPRPGPCSLASLAGDDELLQTGNEASGG